MRGLIAAAWLLGAGVAHADMAPAGGCCGGKAHSGAPVSGASAGVGVALIALARRRRRAREERQD